MKTKLNLTIDEELVPLSKAYAQSRGMSILQLIENFLREVTRKNNRAFAQKWQGRFKLAERRGAQV